MRQTLDDYVKRLIELKVSNADLPKLRKLFNNMIRHPNGEIFEIHNENLSIIKDELYNLLRPTIRDMQWLREDSNELIRKENDEQDTGRQENQ